MIKTHCNKGLHPWTAEKLPFKEQILKPLGEMPEEEWDWSAHCAKEDLKE